MANRNILLSFLFLVTTLPFMAFGHRPTVKTSHEIRELIELGFKPVSVQEQVVRVSQEKVPYTQNSLPLPIKNLLPENPIGSLPHQLESYSKPDYYHLGVDIRTNRDEKIYSPVAGKVEAGFYNYIDAENGSTQKVFLSYADYAAKKAKAPLSVYYFEVAITDDYGYRFELHHVDSKSLPEEIIQKILNGSRVEEGDYIGNVHTLPRQNSKLPYHHLHYNIVSPSGIYLNPLYYSKAIPDDTPPEILAINSVHKTECALGLPILDKIENETSNFIIVHVKDFIQGPYYPMPPARLRAIFRDIIWEQDFSESLANANGVLPDIRDIYLQHYCDFKGLKHRGSMSSRFYMKIPVPAHYNGEVTIEATDTAGNTSSKKAFISTPSI